MNVTKIRVLLKAGGQGAGRMGEEEIRGQGAQSAWERKRLGRMGAVLGKLCVIVQKFSWLHQMPIGKLPSLHGF